MAGDIRSLLALNDGDALSEANALLMELIGAAKGTGGTGEIVLKIKVKDDRDSGMVRTEVSITSKMPKRPALSMMYFVRDGALSVHNPRQATMFHEVAAPEADSGEESAAAQLPIRGNRLGDGEARRAE